MRHGATGNSTAGRRSRNRGGNGNGGGNSGGGRRGGNNNRMQVFDSNGPDVRIRGTAHQIYDKYMALSRDAQVSGDNILGESYLQHAEHYQRIINSWQEQAESRAQAQEQQEQQKSQPQSQARQQTQKGDDDLGLPSSIIGDAPVSKAKEENKDVQLEDA